MEEHTLCAASIQQQQNTDKQKTILIYIQIFIYKFTNKYIQKQYNK